MPVKVGDVFCTLNKKLDSYVAYQIIELPNSTRTEAKNAYAIALLDWTGKEFPTKQELLHMSVLHREYFYWENDPVYYYCEGEIPDSYKYIENIPPLINNNNPWYSLWESDWGDGEEMWRALYWRKIPIERRQNLRASMNSSNIIKVGDLELPESLTKIGEDELSYIHDIEFLERFPGLSELHINTYRPEIIEYIKRNHCIETIHINNHKQSTLDLRGSLLTTLYIDATDLKELYVNPELDRLNISGTVYQDLVVYAQENGKNIFLDIDGSVPCIQSLSHVDSYHAYNIEDVDIEIFAQSYPYVSMLRLWGNPGNIKNISSLKKLSSLRILTLYDLFGFKGDEFPLPENFPKLEVLWFESLPEESAHIIESLYKKDKKNTLNFSISKPRNSTWLKENFENPFDEWKKYPDIGKQYAQTARDEYRRIQSNINDIIVMSKNGMSKNALINSFYEIGENYIMAFNTMNERHLFIKQEQHDVIFSLFYTLVDKANQQLGGIIDMENLKKHCNKIKDF